MNQTSFEAEQRVLGALLLDGTALERIAGVLTPQDFYRPENGAIFKAALALYEGGIPIDLLLMREQLQKQGDFELIGGEAKLSSLVAGVPTSQGIEYHAKLVKNKATLRQLSLMGEKIQLTTDDPAYTADEALQKSAELLEKIQDENSRSFADSDITHISTQKEIAIERLVHPNAISGEATGIKSVDDLWLGMAPGDVIIIGGDTAQGKSMLMQRIALNVALRNVPILYFSLEMPLGEQTARFYSMMKSQGIVEPSTVADSLPIYYYAGKSEMDLAILDKIIVTSIRLYGTAVCFIDHLHYFSNSVDNTTNEVGLISRKIKRMAVRYNIPIVLISTLRKRTKSGVPGMSDLKDSVMIGYDADIVTMVWRDREATKGEDKVVTVKVVKNRVRGKEGSAELYITNDWNLVEYKPTAQQYAEKVFAAHSSYKDD